MSKKTLIRHTLKPTFLGYSCPGKDNTIQVKENFYFSPAMVINAYKAEVIYKRDKINEALFPIYKKALNIEESKLTDVLFKIIQIEKQTGKQMKDIAKYIQAYIGQQCSFYRKEGEKIVPVDSNRLLNAYLSAKEGKNINQIKDILFK